RAVVRILSPVRVAGTGQWESALLSLYGSRSWSAVWDRGAPFPLLGCSGDPWDRYSDGSVSRDMLTAIKEFSQYTENTFENFVHVICKLTQFTFFRKFLESFNFYSLAV